MKILIPSYNRAELCITHRLIPEAQVVVPHSQSVSYMTKMEGGNLISIPDSNDGNIARKRNSCLELFPEERIVMLDDDITAFKKLDLKTGKLVTLDYEGIIGMFEAVFAQMERFGFQMGGIYPIDNAFYMERKTNPKGFIIGSCMMFEKGFKERFDENCMAKEDYEMTCQQMLNHGGVARLDWYTHEKKEYLGQGGVAEQRTVSNIDGAATEYLLRKYPSLLKKNPKREDQILIR